MDKMSSSDKTVDVNQDSTRNRKNQTEILSLNIRKGFILKNKFEQIKLKILEALPKICMFQEVEIPFCQKEELMKDIQIDGYHIIYSKISYSNNCCIMAFIRLDIKWEMIEPTQSVVPTLGIICQEGKNKYIVCSHYKPHASSYSNGISNLKLTEMLVQEWDNIVNRYTNVEVIFLGDTNVDWNRDNTVDRPQIGAMDEFLSKNGFKEIIREHTHRTIIKDTAQFNQIDHCFTNKHRLFTNFELCDFSDHYWIWVCGEINDGDFKQTYIKKRNYKNFSPREFLAKLHTLLLVNAFFEFIILI